MTHNLSQTDRLIRMAIAITIGILYYTGILSGTLATVLMVIASVLFVSGLVRFCPLYTLLGIKKT